MSFVTFALAYAILLRDLLPVGPLIGLTIFYSFRNALPFANSLFRFAAVPSDKTFHTALQSQLNLIYEHAVAARAEWVLHGVIALSVVQQFLSAILLFLLLLGLRNRFRLK